jgi:hypothetical protein
VVETDWEGVVFGDSSPPGVFNKIGLEFPQVVQVLGSDQAANPV